jgi:peptide deformylase
LGERFSKKSNPRIMSGMSYMVELGDPVLRQVADPVADIFSPETSAIIDRMMQTLAEQRGIGIAAPQIGVPKQLFIVAPNQELRPPYDTINTGLVVINPKITQHNVALTHEWEGCLSIPGIRGLVPRHCDITIEYTNMHGEVRSERYKDFTARIFLHEYDHLVGTVFIDRIENLKEHLITDASYMKMMEDDE